MIQYLSDAWAKKFAAENGLSANGEDLEQTDSALHQHHSVKTKEIKTFQPSCSRGNRTRYFLKVQDGCNYYCTYCTIPFARGNSRNPSIESLVAQCEQAAAEGGKEIVITGVNIGDFGQTTHERFLDLVKAMDQVEVSSVIVSPVWNKTFAMTISLPIAQRAVPSCLTSTSHCRVEATRCSS